MPHLYSQAVFDKFDDIIRVLEIFDYDAPQQVKRGDATGMLEMADIYECRPEFAEFMLSNKLRFGVRDEFLAHQEIGS